MDTTTALEMPTNTTAARRPMTTRRGSLSASDPYGFNTEAETARSSASRITIVRVPQQNPEPQNGHRHREQVRRQSWGSNSSASSSGRPGGPGGRLSFAFSTFTPINANANAGTGGPPSSPGRPGTGGGSQASGPPSPTLFHRTGSSQNLDRMGSVGMVGRSPTLTAQQICDLAASAISQKPPVADAADVESKPATFLVLPDEEYLPFLDRPSEVTALITSPPTSRLMTLLAQTFAPDLRAPYDPEHPPTALNNNPTIWSYADLVHWLQTTKREDADDREWVARARTCVLSRSELIWSRLKAALGVPPELEDDEYEDDEDVAPYEDDHDHDPSSAPGASLEEHEREAWLEPILPGDTATCVASPIVLTPGGGSEAAFGMESIGEGAEEEASASPATGNDESKTLEQAIQGLRLSTPMLEVVPMLRAPASPTSLRRSLSTSSHDPQGSSEARRRSALAMAGPGRVRRSHQQERGTGDPLFPSSFATLTMAPSLVAK